MSKAYPIARQNGQARQPRYPPHRLVCTNSRGDTATITTVIKTQGSDTKLIGQMQPYDEAKGLSRLDLASQQIPPLVTQIADGENGGGGMNQCPPNGFQRARGGSGSLPPILNRTHNPAAPQ